VAVVGAAVVQHAAGADRPRRLQVVQGVAHQHRHRGVDPQRGQVRDQVLGLAGAAGHLQPVHPGEEAGDPQPLDQRHQLLVAPHGQQRLAHAGRLGGLQRRQRVGGQPQPLHPGVVAVVVGVVQRPPLLRRDGAAGHQLVEPLHRAGEVGAVGVGVDRGDAEPRQRVVDGRHHRVVVVEQGAVPVPHQVPDAVSHW